LHTCTWLRWLGPSRGQTLSAAPLDDKGDHGQRDERDLRLDRAIREKRIVAAVRIHDYRDGNVPVLARMLEKRIRAYRAIGYETVAAATPPAPVEHVCPRLLRRREGHAGAMTLGSSPATVARCGLGRQG